MSNPSPSDSASRPGQVPALIIGAGPVGLTMACELARHGVACRIVERDEGPTDQSRALAIWERTLEVFDNVGIIDRVLDRGKRLHGLNAYAGGRRLLHVGLDLEGEDTPYPFAITLPQGETQRALIERLGELGTEVEWRTSLTDLRTDADGVTATVAGPDGREQSIRADWLIGCDGARSLVRQKLGVAFEGTEYEEIFLLSDVKIAWSLPDDEAQVFLVDQGGAVAAFPLPEPGRWRLIDATGAVSSDDPGVILSRFRDLLRNHGHPEAELTEPVWTTAFRLHRRLARLYRVGRCFLAGDAAHIHSPVGGQGMNVGIQDAYNLAWKLALVVAEESPEKLLDSYGAERRPIAQSILRGTDLMTRAITLRHPIPESIRNGLAGLLGEFGFVRRKVARRLSELEIRYPNSPIVAEDRSSLFQAISPSGDDPGLRAHLDFGFGSGPGPGDRAPDVPLGLSGSGPQRLFEVLRGTGHTLLIFEGRERSPEVSRAIEAVGDQVRERYAERVVAHLVTRPGEGTKDLLHWEGPRLPDPDGKLHQTYGASAPGLYLIRPDGYVGYRAQPPDAGKLAAYLDRIFISHR